MSALLATATAALPDLAHLRRTLAGIVSETNGHGAKRRPLKEALWQWPGDWLFERSRVPADIVSIGALVGTSIARIGAAHVFLFTLIASKVPFATNVVRAVVHRDITYWTRPQAHQPITIVEAPLPPMESDPNARGVPRWLRWMVKRAEDGHRIAGFFDDWLNQRSRVPAFVIEASLLAFGFFVAPIPWVILFPINTVVAAVPGILGAYLGFRNHDLARWTRGGMRQRDQLLGRRPARDSETQVTVSGVGLSGVDGAAAATGVATPAPEPIAAPQLRRTPTAVQRRVVSPSLAPVTAVSAGPSRTAAAAPVRHPQRISGPVRPSFDLNL